MKNINLEECKIILNNEVVKKKKAVKSLTNHLRCNESDLYYLFQKGKFPDKGKISDDLFFFFHGLGCTVKNEKEGWSIALEFGSKGEVFAFDKGTICYILSIHIDDCDALIKMLQEEKIIKLVDEGLYNLLQKNPNFNDWSSEEEEIDASVADKFVVIS